MNAVTSAPRVFKCVGQAFTTFVVKAFASWCIPRWLLERRLVLKRRKAARSRKQGGKKQSNCTWSKQTITQVLVRCWQKEMCYVLPSPFSFLAHVAFGRFCRPSLQCVWGPSPSHHQGRILIDSFGLMRCFSNKWKRKGKARWVEEANGKELPS